MSNTSWYRRSLWNYKGNKEYTKSGYEAAKERFIPDDLEVDCSDRHYVITGCNSGIGLEIAREVAKRGGVLHMVCRNFEAMKDARSDLITNTGNDKIHIHALDLSKPRDVAAWSEKFAATQEKIHVLINNAGCMVHERKIDEDGIETNFAVNTLAVHIMIMTLLPVMQRNEDARVVTVSSAGMLVVKLDPMDLMHTQLEPFNGTLVYSQNKRQQVVMTLWYAQRFANIHFSVMHPGWADTPAVRNSMPKFFEMMKDNLRTPTEGADTAVWLAISKSAVKYPSGFFFQDREPVSTHLPLAWTKTSIEEEDLLMEKLMVIFQKITSEKPDGEIISNGDNVSIMNSHNAVNGVKAPFQANGTTLISKSENAELFKDGEEVEQQTELESTVLEEPLCEPVSNPNEGEDPINIGSSPEIKAEEDESSEDPMNNGSSLEIKAEEEESSEQIDDTTSKTTTSLQDACPSPQPSEVGSADVKEDTVSEVSMPKEPIIDPTTADTEDLTSMDTEKEQVTDTLTSEKCQ